MINTLRSEFRKLLTVRSTYILAGFCLAVTVFFAFYAEGLRSPSVVGDPGKLASEINSAAQALGRFIAIAGVLLVAHEYRYNTIMYTLTAARNRGSVLLAKILAVTVFSVLLTLLVCLLAPFLAHLGMSIKGVDIVPQTIPFMDLLPKVVYYGWAYSMIAMIITAIVRSQVAAFVVYLLFPVVEQLLTLLLKENAKYLPYMTLEGTMASSGSYSNAAWVLLAYIVGGWLVAYTLFARRDAN